MKINKLKQRLHQDHPMTAATTAAAINLRMPEDVVEDLQRLAPLLGFSGYQSLIRAYIGQGLRTDLERLEGRGTSRACASTAWKRRWSRRRWRKRGPMLT